MSARNLIYGVAGRASLAFEVARKLRGDRWHRNADSPVQELDKTGLVASKPEPVQLLYEGPDVLFPKYDSLAQSFWRAQELTLFHRHRNNLTPPVLDFGCGDGSFASVLVRTIDYGIDIDPDAIALARQTGAYGSLVQSQAGSIPVPDRSVRSILSNSVLEHVADLPTVMKDLHRVLDVGGVLMAAVPVKQFERDLATYYGRKESVQINWDFFHRNLLEAEEWRNLLERTGFTIVLLKQYQPDWFTFWFRMFRLFGNRGFGGIFPSLRDRIWKRYHVQLLDMVRRSVDATEQGGNIFVLARKI